MEQSASLPASEKLPIPSRKPAKFAKTHGPLASMNINVMEWNGGNAMYEAAGGPSTTEGATIIQEIDLIREGLAWHPDIKRMPEFSKLIQNIEDAL